MSRLQSFIDTAKLVSVFSGLVVALAVAGPAAPRQAASTQIPRPAASRPIDPSKLDPADFTGRYPAVLIDVHDGDTIIVLKYEPVHIRLADIDAPEIRDNPHGKADPVNGPLSRQHLIKILGAKRLYVADDVRRSGEVDITFERHVAQVFVVDDKTGKMISVNRKMVEDGFARESHR